MPVAAARWFRRGGPGRSLRRPPVKSAPGDLNRSGKERQDGIAARVKRANRGGTMADLTEAVAALPDKSLLLLDDDAPLRTRLGRALESRGFEPVLVGSV